MRAVTLAVACALVAGCGGAPTGPTVDAARIGGRLSRTRFMAFGDSLTVGEVTNPRAQFDSQRSTPMVAVPAASYPVQLQGLLRARYPGQASEITVANAGAGGERLTAAMLRFEEALNAHRPEVVLLMEGVNDLGSLGPELSTDILQSMAQQALSRNVRVFLASMLPTRAGGRLSQSVPTLLLMNTKLQAMAVQKGLVYVDLYDTLLPEVDAIIGADGLHPTEAGYRRVADVFLGAIIGDLEGR